PNPWYQTARMRIECSPRRGASANSATALTPLSQRFTRDHSPTVYDRSFSRDTVPVYRSSARTTYPTCGPRPSVNRPALSLTRIGIVTYPSVRATATFVAPAKALSTSGTPVGAKGRSAAPAGDLNVNSGWIDKRPLSFTSMKPPRSHDRSRSAFETPDSVLPTTSNLIPPCTRSDANLSPNSRTSSACPRAA